MKKTEVRWISKDDDSGACELWGSKPWRRQGVWIGRQYKGVVSYDTVFDTSTKKGIKIKKGGLAKVTIERQY